MDPLTKAREVTEVRRQYEAAETREDRIRLARLLESMYTPSKEEPAKALLK